MRYKNEKHKEMIEEFKRGNVITECRYGDGGSCNCDCNKFYECWVKPEEDKEANKLERELNEVDGMC